MAFFESSVDLPCSAGEAFEFLIQPHHIRDISPPSLSLNFTKAPPMLSLGSQMEFDVVHFGQVQKIIHEIVEFESPQFFIETLVKGPLPKWVYTHRFEPNGLGVTVIDEIEFEPPKGLLGFIVTEKKLFEQLEDGFDHRYQCLENEFASE